MPARDWPAAVVKTPPTASRLIGTDTVSAQPLLLRFGFQLVAVAVAVESDATRLRVVPPLTVVNVPVA